MPDPSGGQTTSTDTEPSKDIPSKPCGGDLVHPTSSMNGDNENAMPMDAINGVVSNERRSRKPRPAGSKSIEKAFSRVDLLPPSRFGSPDAALKAEFYIKGRDWKELLWEYIKQFKPPPLDWAQTYPLKNFVFDLLAGISSGILTVPQGLAYASLVGLPPIYGLYTALAPCIVYVLLGPNPIISVGPSSVLSLIVASVVVGSENPVLTATTLSFLSGLLILLLGICRLGFVALIISKPVAIGFTAGAAVLIALTQVHHICGLTMTSPTSLVNWFELFIAAGKKGPWNGWAALMGLLCLAFLLALKILAGIYKKVQWIPGGVIVLIVTILVTWGWRLDDHASLSVIGHIPGGLPAAFNPVLSIGSDLSRVASQFLVISAIAVVDLISLSQTFSVKHGKDLNTDMELVALGVAMFLGSFFQSFPATASFSRTSLNETFRAKSQLANAFACMVLVIVLLWATQLFYYLPGTALAAILVSTTWGLFEVRETIFIWKTKKRDFIVMSISFLVTLLAGVAIGILVSVCVNIFFILWDQHRMLPREVGELPVHEPATLFDKVHPDVLLEEMGIEPSDSLFVYRNEHAHAYDHPHLLIVRPTDSITYINVDITFIKVLHRAKDKLEATYSKLVSEDLALTESEDDDDDDYDTTDDQDVTSSPDFAKMRTNAPPSTDTIAPAGGPADPETAPKIRSWDDPEEENPKNKKKRLKLEKMRMKAELKLKKELARTGRNTKNMDEGLTSMAKASKSAVDATQNLIGFVILDLVYVNQIDSTVLRRMQDSFETLKSSNIGLCIVRPKPRILHFLVTGGIVGLVGQDFVLDSVRLAAKRCNYVLVVARRHRDAQKRAEARSNGHIGVPMPPRV